MPLDYQRNIDIKLLEGTSVLSSFRLFKAVFENDLISILKTGGLVSSEGALIKNPDNLYAAYQRRVNEAHPALKNVIYVAATRLTSMEWINRLGQYGSVVLLLKDSLLNQPNTTYSYFDSGISVSTHDKRLEFFKGELLTESELIKGEKARYDDRGQQIFGSQDFTEVHVRTKISLSEIEEIIFYGRPPVTEERQLLESAKIPFRHKGVIYASNRPVENQRNINPGVEIPILPPLDGLIPLPLPLPIPLPIPTVTSPLIEPAVLPDFQELPKVIKPSKTPPALEPTDPIPTDKIANFKDFKSVQDAYEWLKQGKPLEIDFHPSNLPIALGCAAHSSGSLIYSKIVDKGVGKQIQLSEGSQFMCTAMNLF